MNYLLTTLLLSILTYTAFSFTKEMKRYELFCLYRQLPKDDMFYGTYVVSGYNEQGMALQVFSPSNEIIHKIEREKEGSFHIESTVEGDYRVCFRNLEKELAYVTFEVHAPKSDQRGRSGIGADEISGVSMMLKDVLRQVRKVRTNLSFQDMRDRVHTKNLDELSSKLKWSTFFKVLVLGAIGAAQIYLLTSFFKKKEKIRV